MNIKRGDIRTDRELKIQNGIRPGRTPDLKVRVKGKWVDTRKLKRNG